MRGMYLTRVAIPQRVIEEYVRGKLYEECAKLVGA
jgi:hypothetical protein